MGARIKLFLNDRRKEVVIFVLFFLVSTMSFALGYLSVGQTGHAPIVIQKADASAQ